MFKRQKKVYLTLNGQEYALLRGCLLRWRNKLLLEGKHPDPVDELLERYRVGNMCKAAQGADGMSVKDAGQAVVVCGNLEEQYDKDYWTVDCAAAAENLLLACHSLGLGACWCGIYPNQERIEAFTRLFDLPAHIKPLALVVIGYPRLEARQPSDRFNETKVHYNKY